MDRKLVTLSAVAALALISIAGAEAIGYQSWDMSDPANPKLLDQFTALGQIVGDPEHEEAYLMNPRAGNRTCFEPSCGCSVTMQSTRSRAPHWVSPSLVCPMSRGRLVADAARRT